MQHRMWEIDADGTRSPWVAKFYKTKEAKEVYYEDAKLNMIAQSYADDFNKLANIREKIAFVPSYVLELSNGKVCMAEPVGYLVLSVWASSYGLSPFGDCTLR